MDYSLTANDFFSPFLNSYSPPQEYGDLITSQESNDPLSSLEWMLGVEKWIENDSEKVPLCAEELEQESRKNIDVQRKPNKFSRSVSGKFWVNAKAGKGKNEKLQITLEKVLKAIELTLELCEEYTIQLSEGKSEFDPKKCKDPSLRNYIINKYNTTDDLIDTRVDRLTRNILKIRILSNLKFIFSSVFEFIFSINKLTKNKKRQFELIENSLEKQCATCYLSIMGRVKNKTASSESTNIAKLITDLQKLLPHYSKTEAEWLEKVAASATEAQSGSKSVFS